MYSNITIFYFFFCLYLWNPSPFFGLPCNEIEDFTSTELISWYVPDSQHDISLWISFYNTDLNCTLKVKHFK